jgi:two-component system sensor histidine kinase KdpD
MIVGRRPAWWGLVAGIVASALAGATVVVALIEATIDIENASAVYLVAVSAVAIVVGTWPAVATAVGAFLLYNFLFVDPRYTFTVSRAEELVTLVLLLFVGVVISRLAGLQRQRAQEAERREHEARALFGIGRELVRSERLADAILAVADRLAAEAGMERVWVGLGQTLGAERQVATDADGRTLRSAQASHHVLHRDSAEGAARWVRIHRPTAVASAVRTDAVLGRRYYRIELRAGDELVGSLWAERRGHDLPRVEETRLLAAAADQLGAAVRRDRLLGQAAELEIARRSDELKSAFVDSVSHDLRTPLASIRAAAGSLADADIDLPPDERRAIAAGIDEEADRLNRLVDDLLDMSRIQGGALVPDLEIIPLTELVRPAVDRAHQSRRPGSIEAAVPDDLPDVRVDAALLDRVLENLLDNAVRHAGSAAPIRISATVAAVGAVELTVEDGGPGVPDERLASIFERFSSQEHTVQGRRGSGLGLAIVRGLTEAMGGSVSAGRSELGGLAVTLRLPSAEPNPA